MKEEMCGKRVDFRLTADMSEQKKGWVKGEEQEDLVGIVYWKTYACKEMKNIITAQFVIFDFF